MKPFAGTKMKPFVGEGDAHVLHHFKPDWPRQYNKPNLWQGSEYGQEDGKGAMLSIFIMTSSITMNMSIDHQAIMTNEH